VFGSNRPVPKEVYARLKALEERVLFLEGVSPEYFSVTQTIMKTSQSDDDDVTQSKESDAEAIASLSSINKRIQELRSNLVNKSESIVKMEL
jgi:MAP3K12-binding inhibitory protein 1